MTYLRQQNKSRSFGRQQPEARFIPLPPKQRMAPPIEKPVLKTLHFPLMKDLPVPQLTLREIAWTIMDWQMQMDKRELNENVNRLWSSQRLSAIEKDYVMTLLPKLRDEEIRKQLEGTL